MSGVPRCRHMQSPLRFLVFDSLVPFYILLISLVIKRRVRERKLHTRPGNSPFYQTQKLHNAEIDSLDLLCVQRLTCAQKKAGRSVAYAIANYDIRNMDHNSRLHAEQRRRKSTVRLFFLSYNNFPL